MSSLQHLKVISSTDKLPKILEDTLCQIPIHVKKENMRNMPCNLKHTSQVCMCVGVNGTIFFQ